jgi:hypothetical protein
MAVPFYYEFNPLIKGPLTWSTKAHSCQPASQFFAANKRTHEESCANELFLEHLPVLPLVCKTVQVFADEITKQFCLGRSCHTLALWPAKHSDTTKNKV